ncbi:DNA repair protein XRCC3 isoform X2 [Myiozetetes cayanensis]|uniref:DNA repair protein XRCC3 isoform X2 n=1 Tax=Myiozetetes cayanensis TaxID=478635 RepID=UPI00216107D2|nr:DNA repair protein XRCC3 isoform X2 [Myiozetetes cayanensis]
MDWDQFDLNPRTVAALKKADIKSVKEILNLSGADLQRLMKLPSTDIQCLLTTVSRTLRRNSMVTALQLYQDKDHLTSQSQKLSLGCSVLDNLLKGGIPLVGITELAGESSAGKTQISLQLCLCVQYPYKYGGLESGAVYICTEDSFPSKRLQQLIGQQHKLRADVPAEIIQKIRFGNSIFVEHAADLDTFHRCITTRLSLLLARGMVRLVVIDSIAALFRCEFGVSESVMKARYLQTFGAQLHSLSTRFRTPIMCINQGSGEQSCSSTWNNLGKSAADETDGQPDIPAWTSLWSGIALHWKCQDFEGSFCSSSPSILLLLYSTVGRCKRDKITPLHGEVFCSKKKVSELCFRKNY